MEQDSFPRLAARTKNFTLGLPRAFAVSPDGHRVLFLRSRTGTSSSHSVWLYDVTSRTERELADPAVLLDKPDEQLTAEERARRERMRVTSSGVVAFSTDQDVRRVAFALSSRLFVLDVVEGTPAREVTTTSSVIDPRLDPTGRRVAYVGEDGLHVVDETDGDRLLAGPESGEPPEVRWGLAEFAAAEELSRDRGFWWAPDGESLLVERYDESAVRLWHIADPADPELEPTRVRYPQAGTDNALVSLALFGLHGDRVDVDWRSDAALGGHVLEYLADVEWAAGRPLLALLSRDQTRLEFREVDPATGHTTLVRVLVDDAWVELLPGTPRRLEDGRLLHAVDVGETCHLALDGHRFSPEGVQVRRVVSLEDAAVVALVSPPGPVGSIVLARMGFDGSMVALSDGEGTVSAAAAGGETVVAAQHALRHTIVGTDVRVGGQMAGSLASVAEPIPLSPEPEILQTGPRGYPTVVLFPTGHVRGSRRLPVLMCPYGGPHVQTVIRSSRAYLEEQWLADQGCVVVVADGRGMAGRGPAWDRLARHDFVGTIDDQVDVLHEVADRYSEDVDTARVAIRGWSFGGYVAALGVLRHPDVFACAIAGAPVTDLRFYDTCYTERYLGHPSDNAAVYDANSLIPLGTNSAGR